MSASMYGKDASQMRHMENIYYPDPPTYNTTTKETKVVEQSYDVNIFLYANTIFLRWSR